jgi:pimeloyl-ACP methyl ester carboxylesterase
MTSGRAIVRLIIAVAVTCIVAASAANAPPDEAPPVRYWHLPTHSRIAYLKFNALGERRTYPVVFLHGGPGAYVVTLEPTTRVLSQLRQDGFDVYAYDQVGGGMSQRLTDITQYTVARHVADLEAIRREIHAQRLILIGSSWGATLAARYVAEFSERVDRVIFAGPGALHPAAWRATGYGRVEERFSSDESTRFQALVNRSDLERAMKLLTSDPAGALREFPHAEGDRLFDQVTNRFYLPHLGCSHSKSDVTSKGYGFWANRMTGRDLDLSQDPTPALRHNRVRALILRGECEYMQRAVAEQYRDVFPNSALVDVPGAGHMIYWDQPEAFLATVRSFLR